MECGRCGKNNPADTLYCGACGTKLGEPNAGSPAFTRTIETPPGEWGRGRLLGGRYEILEKIGQGGMGSVYRVLDTKLNEEMALKRLAPEVAADARAAERFKNELKLARRILHRNVGRVYDFHEVDGLTFITMEYVPGEDLKSLLRRAGRLSPEKTVELATQICEGLAEAHRLGVIHRDLKPHNILLDRDGRPRIMDFGIARLQGGTDLTDPGALIGTPDYMTPEQAEGRPADPRSDIYSLGVILYEMLTGRVPFQSETALGVLHQHRTAPPPDPRAFNPQVPDLLRAAVLKCLEKDSAARFQKAGELKGALDEIAGGFSAVPPETSRTGPVSRPSGTRPPTAERGPVRSIAVLPFKDLSPQRDQDYLCEGLAEELINALTQIEDLRVAARTSSFSFKAKDEDVRGIGSALNVGAVLEGSVQKSGGRLRITAQLVDVADGYQIWSEKFDRSMKDVFAVQDEISMAIVGKLRVGLREGEKEKLVKKHTRDKDAYNLYLQGRYYWNRRYRGDMIKAVDFFGRAIRRDPEYVLPYVGIADVFNIFGQWAFIPPGNAYAQSKTALQRALEIDDSVSDIYSSMGFMAQSYEADLPASDALYRRSLELNPRNSYAHAWYSVALMTMGRVGEAAAEIERAIALDPMFNLFASLKGIILGVSGRAEEGRAQILKAIAMDPAQPMPYLFLGIVALTSPARTDLAIEYLEKAAGFGITFALGWLGLAYAQAGRAGDAEKILARVEAVEREWFIPPVKRLLLVFKPGLKPFRGLRRKYAAPLTKALIYAGLNRLDEAVAEMEKSARSHDYFLPHLLHLAFSTIPTAAALFADPRIKDLKARIG